jgi:hypothetical protein
MPPSSPNRKFRRCAPHPNPDQPLPSSAGSLRQRTPMLHLLSEVIAAISIIEKPQKSRDNGKNTEAQPDPDPNGGIGFCAVHPTHKIKRRSDRSDRRSHQETNYRSTSGSVHYQYFLALGGISDVSTASNSNLGSSASGAKYAFVVFSQFLSSRSGKSGL